MKTIKEVEAHYETPLGKVPADVLHSAVIYHCMKHEIERSALKKDDGKELLVAHYIQPEEIELIDLLIAVIRQHPSTIDVFLESIKSGLEEE